MPRILLVDDEEPLREVLCRALVHMGHEVMEARNGREAVQLCAVEPPDIVLTDLIMPDQEGLQTIRELRHAHPDVKIIAMSGGGRNSAKNYLEVAGRMGAARTLSKPFSTDELAAAIADVLGSA